MKENNLKTSLSFIRFFRWVVLVTLSLSMFGNYYIYDSISPLADVLKKQLGFSDSNIGLLNAIYSIPNVFMVLIGGFIIDRIGTRKAIFIFSALCFLGAILTVLIGEITLMAVGRLIFGLGGETLIVAVTTSIAKWFRGRELSFAFGVKLSIARLGSFAALNSPSWASELYEFWRFPLLISVGFGFLCIIASILYFILERYGELKHSISETTKTEKVVFRDIFTFGKSYWFIVALCVTFYSAIFPFQTFAVKFFMEAHKTSREFGGFLSSMLTLFAMIFTPIFGIIVDRVGKRSFFMMFGSILLMPVFLMMAYTNLSLYIPMSLMGIAFSLIPAVMWPCVAYIVKQSKLGTAYGLMTMIQNIGLSGSNLVIGWANDFAGASAINPSGYNPGMWIFSSFGFFGFLFAYLMRRNEKSSKGCGLDEIKIGKKS